MAYRLRPVVIDTGVVSVIYSGDQRGASFETVLQGFTPIVSFQSLEELLFWPVRNGWGERRSSELLQHIERYEVVWPNLELVQISARLRNQQERIGRRLNTADAWIAATATLLDCPLATLDDDFSAIPNLQLIKSAS